MAFRLTISIKAINQLSSIWRTISICHSIVYILQFVVGKSEFAFVFVNFYNLLIDFVVKMPKRPELTLDQRTLIKVLYKDLGQDADQIREHESLRRSDGSKVLKKTVLCWIDRIEQTGDVKPKIKKGRSPSLDDKAVRKLIRLVDHNPKKSYKKIRSIAVAQWPGQFEVSRRTINRYANRHHYREFLFVNAFL